jgi:hypothetical protein
MAQSFSSTSRTGASPGDYTLARKVATAVGAVFLLVGILGFIPGITTNYDTLAEWGHHSDAKLLGIFEVSILHNLVHVLFGLAGLAMARRTSSAVTYLLAGGAIYLLLWVYGLLVGHNSNANFVPVNGADNWLHLILGLGMVAAGLGCRAAATRSRSAPRR